MQRCYVSRLPSLPVCTPKHIDQSRIYEAQYIGTFTYNMVEFTLAWIQNVTNVLMQNTIFIEISFFKA